MLKRNLRELQGGEHVVTAHQSPHLVMITQGGFNIVLDFGAAGLSGECFHIQTDQVDLSSFTGHCSVPGED